MTLICLFMLYAQVDQSAYHIRNPDLFQVIQREDVYVAPNGEVYLVNFSESRVQHYGADGKPKPHIGRRGKGPGEFTFPTFFQVVGEQLYVRDELNAEISVFKLDGTFVERISTPSRFMRMVRGSGGWFFWTFDSSNPHGGPSTLMFSKKDFDKGEKILDIPTTGGIRGTWVSSNGSDTRITYGPISSGPHILASKDGATIYFADPKLFKIHVFDGATGKLRHVIEREKKLLPFDTEWADAQWEENNEDTIKQYPGVKVDKLYPEKFPAIREMALDPDGNLMVNQWRGKPDGNNYPVAISPDGKDIAMKYSWDEMRRCAGVIGDTAYVIMFEEDEDTGICKVPMADLKTFIEENPITDWSHSRSISISN